LNGTLNLISIVDEEENITTQDEDDHQPTSSLPPNQVKPGPTYRATAIEKQTTTTNLLHKSSILEKQDWTSVPFKFSHNNNLSNVSPAKITQLPLETTRTIPVIKARKEEKSTSNKLSKTNETIISETEKNKIKQNQNNSKTKTISRQQAKIEWFNLLKKEKISSLKELQKLTEIYPELIYTREENKKGKLGANAMYYAITLGKFELVSWLTKQNNPIAGQSFGDFIESIMVELTFIENKHEQAINNFVSFQVKKATSEGKLILMSPMQIDYAKEIHEIKNILDKYDLLTNFKYFLGYSLIGNFRKNNFSKKHESISPYISSGMSIENFDMEEFLSIKYEGGISNFMTLLTYSPVEEIKFSLNLVNDKNDFIHSNIPNSNSFFYAIQNESKRRLEVISILLNSVSDKDKLIYATNIHGINTLSYAIEFNLNEVVALLLDNVSDPDHLAQTSRYAGLTSLMHASETGSPKIIQTLLSKVRDKNTLAQLADANGNTALMFAVARKRTEALKVLLNETPDPDYLLSQITLQGETAYDRAIKNNYHHMLSVLKPSHQLEKLNPDNLKLSSNIVNTKQVNQLKENLNDLVPEKLVDNFNDLFNSINDNNIARAKLIIRSSIDIEKIIRAKNLNETTPLMLAVKNNNIEILDLLLHTTNEKDSLILDSSHEGINAFMIAIKEGYFEATEKLFWSVSDKEKLIYAEVKDGSNALMIAIKYNRLGTARLILQNVKNPSSLAQTKMHSGLTSLMIAAGLGNRLGIRLLLVYGEDQSTQLKMTDPSGNSAMIYAVEGGYLDCVKELLDWGTDKRFLLTHNNQDGETAYTTALKYNHRHLLSLLDPNE
jgi:ankyrin repeat protein